MGEIIASAGFIAGLVGLGGMAVMAIAFELAGREVQAACHFIDWMTKPKQQPNDGYGFSLGLSYSPSQRP